MFKHNVIFHCVACRKIGDTLAFSSGTAVDFSTILWNNKTVSKHIDLKLIISFYLTIGIPLLYFLNLSIIYLTPETIQIPFPLMIAGLFFACVGLFFWVGSFFTLAQNNKFAVLPKKQKRLRIGLYRYLNHPMYVGIFLTFFGVSVADQSFWGMIFTSLCMLPLLLFRAVREDKKLYS
jgi:protein-S-isoprenylcysteine O-methyltransferase Ste14